MANSPQKMAFRAILLGLAIHIAYSEGERVHPLKRDTTSKLVLEASLTGDTVTFSILNSGAKPEKFLNGLKNDFPPTAWIRARDKAKKILTVTSFSTDGYWSPASREGLGLVSPMKLDTLESGQRLERSINVRSLLLARLEDESQAVHIQKTATDVQFRWWVFTDENQSRYVQKETGWIPLRGISLEWRSLPTAPLQKTATCPLCRTPMIVGEDHSFCRAFIQSCSQDHRKPSRRLCHPSCDT